MNLKTLSYIGVILSLFCLTNVLAQESSESGQDTLWTYYEDEPVIITATRLENTAYRTPYSVDYIDQNNIQLAEPTVSLSEALRQVPGFVIQNRQNQALGERITSRGLGSRAQFGVRGVKIIVDDIPLTLADGQAQTSNIDLGSTEQIEVIRGPASSLYGNAAGGVIQLETQILNAQQPLRVEAKGVAGSFGLRKWQMKALGNGHKYNYTVNLSQTQSDGYRNHSAYKYLQLNSVVKFKVTDQLSLTGMLNYYNAPYLMNPSSLSKEDALNNPTKVRGFIVSQGAAEQPTQLQGGVTAKYQVNENDFTRVTLYGIGRTLVNPIPGRIIDLSRNAGGIRTSYHFTFTISRIPVRMITGIDYELQDDKRLEFENNGLPEGAADSIAPSDIFNRLQYGQNLVDQYETVSGYGSFMQFEAGLLPKLNVQGGLRYDWYNFQVNDQLLMGDVDKSGRRTMDQLSPMIGINYLPQPNLSIYSNFSTAFQTPTSSELSNRPNGEGGFNPSLEPERIQSIEGGARGSLFSPRLRYNLTAFTMSVENMIIPYQIADPASEEVFHENAGRARNNGLEMLIRWRPPGRFRWLASYTYMNFTFQDYLVEAGSEGAVQLKGKQVPGVPPHKLFTELAYDHPSGIFGEVQLQWIGEYYTNNFNGPLPGSNDDIKNFVNDAYTTTGLRFGKTFSLANINVRLFGGVDNLFDVRYNASIVPNAFGGNFFEPAPGRHWYLGLNAGFTP